MDEYTGRNDDESSERMFAVCANKHRGIACPALAVGYDPEEPTVVEMVQTYDDEVLADNEVCEFGDTVPETDARRAWKRAIGKSQSEVARMGKQIAHELGWLDAE